MTKPTLLSTSYVTSIVLILQVLHRSKKDLFLLQILFFSPFFFMVTHPYHPYLPVDTPWGGWGGCAGSQRLCDPQLHPLNLSGLQFPCPGVWSTQTTPS